MRAKLLAGAVIGAALAVPATAEAAYDYARFQSPSGNIRCAYRNQVGIGCYTLNNGLGVVLRSFDRAYYLSAFALSIPAGPTLYYGQTWGFSSFRCSSQPAGMKCWSAVTGHGFLINRDSRRIF
jgi:hypothetical protein